MFLEIQVRAALAGNNLEGPVRPLMEHVAAALGVSAFEFVHIETVLRIQRGARAQARRARCGAARDRELDEAYRVLETSSTASDEEVVKAYRRQLQPPPSRQAEGERPARVDAAHAKQRTQQIIEAWELVRERRGFR